MSNGKSSYYSLALVSQFETALTAARLLRDTAEGISYEKGCSNSALLHEKASVKTADIRTKLTSEFLAPIARDDILLLSQNAAHLCCCCRQVCSLLYIYDLKRAPEDFLVLCDRFIGLCEINLSMIKEFFGKKSAVDYFAVIDKEKSLFDAEFRAALKKLFAMTQNTMVLFIRTDLYNQLKAMGELCFEISQIVSRIILRNS